MDRMLVAFRELIRGELARIAFQAPWEYRVAKVRTGPPILLDLQSATDDMPDLIKVPLRRSAFGGYSEPKIGETVVVMFLNGDPTKPYADSLDPSVDVDNAQVTANTQIRIGKSGSQPCVRKGDGVNCGYLTFSNPTTIDRYFPGTVAGKTAADNRVTALGGPPAFRFDLNDGTVDASVAVGGVINQGSGKVTVE